MRKRVPHQRDIEYFIKKHKEFFPETDYCYENAVYTSNTTPVINIYCKTHGMFDTKAKPLKNVSTNSCSKCREELKLHEFTTKANKIHSGKYDYSQLTSPLHMSKKNNIICPVHGLQKQTPSNHLITGGCKECGKLVGGTRLTTEEFVTKAKEIHSNKYNYSKVKYVNGRTKIKIICPIHGEFIQNAGSHLEGKGCQDCAERGLNMSAPAYLYYIKISLSSRVLYKIGVTNNTVAKRFKEDPLRGDISTVQLKMYTTGYEAYTEEQRLHKLHREHRYIGVDILRTGNTELFTKDVLSLDV